MSTVLKIAVNVRLLIPGKLEGIGRFSHEILWRLVRDHPEVHFDFLFDREVPKQFLYGPNVKGHRLFPPTRHPLLYPPWFEASLPRRLGKLKPDLFLSMDGFLSLKSKVPQVPIIHDLNFEFQPDWLPGRVGRYYRKWFPRFAKKAVRIGTVSEFSRQDIHKTYSIPLDQIEVVSNAASNVFAPLSGMERATAKAEFGRGAPYFLYVGSMHARKNVAGMIEGFKRFVETTDAPHKLLLAGVAMWKEDDSLFNDEALKNRLLRLGRVSDETLVRLYNGAEALVYVPYFEGFGLPIVEAMASGCPVMTSDRGAMQEVAAGAAYQANPDDPDSIARGFARLSESESMLAELRSAGLKRAEAYAWDKSAAQLWNLVEHALDRS